MRARYVSSNDCYKDLSLTQERLESRVHAGAGLELLDRELESTVYFVVPIVAHVPRRARQSTSRSVGFLE